MENETVNVKVLYCMKTKDSKKTLIKFALENEETKISKGMLIIDQWIDNGKIFDRIDSDLIDVFLEGTITYKHTYDKNAVIQLAELFDADGNNILA